jgi:hypothetical protein
VIEKWGSYISSKVCGAEIIIAKINYTLYASNAKASLPHSSAASFRLDRKSIWIAGLAITSILIGGL